MAFLCAAVLYRRDALYNRIQFLFGPILVMTDNIINSPSASTPLDADELLPIREVVRLTGVNPVTLRAWERRHGLLSPVRTEGGHRLYSHADVATIRSIVSWTGRGVAISKVGAMLERSRSVSAQDVPQAPQNDQWSEWWSALRDALNRFDASRLEQIYGQLCATYPLPLVYDQVLVPLWQDQRQQTAFGERSQWLLLDNFLRARLLQRLQLAQRLDAPVVLLLGLPGQTLELEVLVTGLFLANDDIQIQILGTGQPLEELTVVCAAVQPEAVVITAPVMPARDVLEQLQRIERGLDCHLALAGLGAELAESALERSPVASLGATSQLMRNRLAQLLAGKLDT